jgi:hypothetical protein
MLRAACRRLLLVIGVTTLYATQGSYGPAAEARTWTDSTGKFSVDAELVGYKEGKVQLRKPNGNLIAVPLARLSERDQAYLKSVMEPDVHDVLGRPAEFDFSNTPLDEVARSLTKKHKVLFWVEQWALRKEGIAVNVPVTAKSGRGTLAQNLSAALKSLGLIWTTEGDVVVITTPKAVKTDVVTFVYKPARPVNLDELVKEIKTNIAPERWHDVGGRGEIRPAPVGVLMVSQRADILHEISRHYAGFLDPIKLPSTAPAPSGNGRPAPRQVLAQPSECDFADTPLEDAVKQLSDRHPIHIGLYKRSLREAGIPADARITCSLEGVPLQTLLTLMLREVNLTWSVKRTGLIVTTTKHSWTELERVTYRVGDLATSDDCKQFMKLIMWVTDPRTWEDCGGPGSMRCESPGILEINQSYHIHQWIEGLLAALRQAKSAG